MAEPNRMCTDVRPAPSPVYILRGSGSPVTVLEFTDLATRTLLSGCQNGQIHMWDLSTRRIRNSFNVHSGQPVLFATSVESETLLTHGRDGYFKMWKCTGPDYVLNGKLEADGDGFCAAVLLPQGKASSLMAVPSEDSSIRVYDLKSQSSVRTLTVPHDDKLGPCMCMCTVPDQAGFGTRLMAGYESGKMVLWDVGTGKAQHQCSVHEDMVMCLAYSSARLNRGLSGSVTERLVAWTISNEGKIEIVQEVKTTNAGFSDVSIRADDRIVATAGWDKQVRIFNMKSLRPLAILAYHRDSVRCVQFSEDHLLAVGSKDHLISVWDVYSKV